MTIKSTSSNQQGAATIYLVLLLTFMFTSSALIISFSLSRQLRATNEVTDSARAFYAATSGIEQGLMQLVVDPGENNSVDIDDSIDYDDNTQAIFKGTASLVESRDDAAILLPCVSSEGEFRGQQRRLKLGGINANCIE